MEIELLAEMVVKQLADIFHALVTIALVLFAIFITTYIHNMRGD